MIVFSGILPHSPVLMPNIEKEKQQKVAATLAAIVEFEKDLYASEPEVILIISQAKEVNPDAFLLNLSPEYNIDFVEYGDHETKLTFRSADKLALDIQERVEDDEEVPLYLTSDEKLGHSYGVPLFYATTHLKDIKIVPVEVSLLPHQKHFQLGEDIKKELVITSKRVAVIISAELSHKVAKGAPAGFTPGAEKFDKDLIEKLKAKDIEGIKKITEKEAVKVAAYGFKPLLVGLGITHEYNYDFNLLSYEAPFGVGYLVANFRLK